MVSLPSPDGLPVEAVARYDVFLSFTRTAPDAVAGMERIAEALTARGLRVFSGARTDDFDGVSATVTTALATSKVVLAAFPTRYAGQWELTAALLAAARFGDPRARVLVIDPGHGTGRPRPVELLDPPREPADYLRLASLVAARVAAVDRPLGAARRPGGAPLPPQVSNPRPFVGRYQQLWQVHSRLHATDLPRPDPQPAVMVTGLAGSGKTSLAARYAGLYRDAFPGGVFWIGPLGGPAARGDETGVLAEYTSQLRNLAADRLGLDVSVVEPEKLRLMVADTLRANGKHTLWVIDDVPQELSGAVLDQLLIPTRSARTLLTSRIGAPRWEDRSITLGGLSQDDGLALFAEGAGAVPGMDERAAVLALVERCGGHPMVLRGVAGVVRNLPREELVRHLRAAAVTVTEAVERELRELDRLATDLLRVAAVLAPAPFPPALAAGALALSTVDDQARDRLAAAAGQLAEHGLLHPVGTDWEIHPLVCEAVRPGAGLPAVATRAAAALLALLDTNPRLISHARLLAGRTDLPAALRIGLLRKVATHHETSGAGPAALAALDTLLTIDGAGLADLLLAARIGIGCGRYDVAERQARLVIAKAVLTDDCLARERAKVLVAMAQDHRNRHVKALFWPEAEAWLPD
jgi:hypothetical protein